MGLICKIAGGHKWKGCTCERCGLSRDVEHCVETTTTIKQYDEDGSEIEHEVRPWDDLYGAPISYRHFKTVYCSKCGKVFEEAEIM